MNILVFPQLGPGCIAQLPVKKHVLRRTILNRSLGGRTTKMSDPEAASTSWELYYTGLTDAEMSALEALFEACEGKLRPFVFVDPLGNLLLWTEDMSNNVWQTGLLVATGFEDPNGRSGACRITNGAQGYQGISQTVDSPGIYAYSFSIWARSDSTDALRLSIEIGTQAISTHVSVAREWSLLSVSTSAGGVGEQIRCSIELPGGCAADVFGPQLDAQAEASSYRGNTTRSGLHMARFDQDELVRVSNGLDDHSTRIRVITVQE